MSFGKNRFYWHKHLWKAKFTVVFALEVLTHSSSWGDNNNIVCILSLISGNWYNLGIDFIIWSSVSPEGWKKAQRLTAVKSVANLDLNTLQEIMVSVPVVSKQKKDSTVRIFTGNHSVYTCSLVFHVQQLHHVTEPKINQELISTPSYGLSEVGPRQPPFSFLPHGNLKLVKSIDAEWSTWLILTMTFLLKFKKTSAALTDLSLAQNLQILMSCKGIAHLLDFKTEGLVCRENG